MEEKILKTLDFRVTIPSAHAFLVTALRASNTSSKVERLSSFILDGTLLSYSLLAYLPSHIAAAAVFIARHTAGQEQGWSSTLSEYTSYSENQVIPVAKAILKEKSRIDSKWKAVHEKYSHGGVSDTVFSLDFK